MYKPGLAFSLKVTGIFAPFLGSKNQLEIHCFGYGILSDQNKNDNNNSNRNNNKNKIPKYSCKK